MPSPDGHRNIESSTDQDYIDQDFSRATEVGRVVMRGRQVTHHVGVTNSKGRRCTPLSVVVESQREESTEWRGLNPGPSKWSDSEGKRVTD